MPVRGVLFSSTVLALLACAPAADTSADAALVGTWVGTSTITSGTQSGTVVGSLHVKPGALGLVTVDICPDQSSLNATVTGPIAFTLIVPATCPSGVVNGCASAALTYTSGSGHIGTPDGGTLGAGASDGGTATPPDLQATLNFTGAGTLAGCQSSSPVTITFIGTRQ